MAETRNLVTTPRIPSSGTGNWRKDGSGASPASNNNGRDLDDDTPMRQIYGESTYQSLRCELAETYDPGASYRVGWYGWAETNRDTAVALGPGSAYEPSLTGSGYTRGENMDWERVSTAGRQWREHVLTLPTDPNYRDPNGSAVTVEPGVTTLHLFMFNPGSGAFNDAGGSLFVVEKLTGDEIGGYFDGDGRRAVDPTNHDDPDGITFDWLGEPLESGSSATWSAPDPEPEPVTITDPGVTIRGEVGEPIEPLTLTAEPEGVTWSADGLPDGIQIGASSGTIDGTPTADGSGTITITAELDGADDQIGVPYVFGDAPDPDPEPADPWDELDELADTLAPRVAQWIGRGDDAATLELARGMIPVVAEYVRGFTRGHGWKNGVPVIGLQTVIVAAAGRIVANPEQVTYYAAGDYSERPATLTGWTLAELGVLRNHRKVRA